MLFRFLFQFFLEFYFQFIFNECTVCTNWSRPTISLLHFIFTVTIFDSRFILIIFLLPGFSWSVYFSLFFFVFHFFFLYFQYSLFSAIFSFSTKQISSIRRLEHNNNFGWALDIFLVVFTPRMVCVYCILWKIFKLTHSNCVVV